MKDVSLFKRRFFSYDGKYTLVVDGVKKIDGIPIMFGNGIEIGDVLCLVMIQNEVGRSDIPEYNISPMTVREKDFPLLMKEYYFVRKSAVSVPIFTKRLFPEYVLDPSEHKISLSPDDNGASIIRKVFDSLGCGALAHEIKFVDDAKECNNRLTCIEVWSEMKSTDDLIDEIFSDYVTIVFESSIIPPV